MCTSFAVYGERPVYGMNFDFPDVELKFCIQPGEQGPVFYLCFGWEGTFHKVAGMNAAGLFAAAQILVAHFEVVPRPGETLITPYEIFSLALQTEKRVEAVLRVLGGRRLGYTTARKGHQLYADQHGYSCVLEPGPLANRVYPARSPYRIMTNRPESREQNRTELPAIRPGADRYESAQQVIQSCFPAFSVASGFELLERVQLTRGRFKTQCSLVCDPLTGTVYLAVRRDFHKVWKFSLEEGQVEPFSNFSAGQSALLSLEGLLERDLPGLDSVPVGFFGD